MKFPLLFTFFFLLCCRIHVHANLVHVLYSSGQMLNGFIGQPSVAAGYCGFQPEFTAFQCESVVPLLAYSGVYPNETSSAPVYASDGKTVLFETLAALYSNTVEPYVSLLEAGVVESDFWAFVPNGTSANCQDWSALESCSSARIKNPANWTVTIPSFCQVPHAMLCVCMNGQLVTSVPTFFPTHLPTLLPTPLPTQMPTFQSWNSASQTVLTYSGAVGNPYLGYSVAISGDGNTLAVGGPYDSNNIGATWMYVRSGSTWTQQGAKLIGSGYASASEQGSSVSLSSNGNTLAVGGPYDNAIGATWVFTRSGSTWTQQGAKLVGSGYVTETSDEILQGFSVSLSGDGLTLAVGGPYENGVNGAIWIFKYANGMWSQIGAKLTTNAYESSFGIFVTLSGNGTTLVATSLSSVTMFLYANNMWYQEYSFDINGGIPYTGSSLLSTNGDQLIVLQSHTTTGIVYIFTRVGTSWTYYPIHTNINGLMNGVAMDQQGTTFVASACNSNACNSNGNEVLFFFQKNDTGNWVSTGTIDTFINQGSYPVSLAISGQHPYTVAMGTPGYGDEDYSGVTAVITQT